MKNSSRNIDAKIGILQLTRIGDLLQTMQASRQLKKENPNVRLFLVARKSMAKGILFLLEEVFEEIILIDWSDLTGNGRLSVAESVSNAKRIASKVSDIGLDLLINLSFNKSSSYLASLIKANKKMGLSRNELDQVALTDKWSQYVYATVMNSGLNPFNLVDIYKFILGARGLSPEYEEKPRDHIVVVHPFASTKKKRWGPNKWIDFLYKAMRENPGHRFVIVGATEDANEAKELLSSPALEVFQDRLENRAGAGSIEDTYQLLSRAQLLVCHDSMVSHLAALTKTPTVVLSMGTVRPAETTPYQRNVINIVPRRSCFPCKQADSCELLPCHKDISHQLAGEIAGAILKEKTLDRTFFASEVSPFYLNSVSVYAPHFGETGMELIDITEASATIDDIFRTFYRVVWSFYMLGKEENYPLPIAAKDALAILAEHQKGCEYLFELYNFGMKHSKRIVEEARKEAPAIKKIQDDIDRLAEIDQLCAMTKGTYPKLQPIIDFFFVNKANAFGQNIIDISESNLIAFYEGQTFAQIIYDLCGKLTGPAAEKAKAPEV